MEKYDRIFFLDSQFTLVKMKIGIETETELRIDLSKDK